MIVNLTFIKNRKKLLLLFALALILIPAYIYIQSKNGNPVIPGAKPDIVKQEQSLIEKVGKLILLPTGETPQIATVSDKTKLTDQSFFANAENGDKVLLYYQAKKAILYRPSINKIVEVGPLDVSAPTSNLTPTPILISTPSATPNSKQEIKTTPQVPPPIR